MTLSVTPTFEKKAKKFFKKHPDLKEKFKDILKKLQNDPFEPSLKTHKLKGALESFYACSLTFEYRLILLLKIEENQIVLINIGTHDEVY